MNNVIKFAKLRDDVIIPSKRDEDGWYDLYSNFEEDEIVIQQHEIKLIPTGLISAFDNGYKIEFGERGSNTKSKLILMAGKIDSGFRSEWFVALYNTQHYPIIISKKYNDYTLETNVDKNENISIHSKKLYVPYNKAICQFSIEKVAEIDIQEVPIEEIENIKSERGTGSLGSSGK